MTGMTRVTGLAWTTRIPGITGLNWSIGTEGVNGMTVMKRMTLE